MHLSTVGLLEVFAIFPQWHVSYSQWMDCAKHAGFPVLPWAPPLIFDPKKQAILGAMEKHLPVPAISDPREVDANRSDVGSWPRSLSFPASPAQCQTSKPHGLLTASFQRSSSSPRQRELDTQNEKKITWSVACKKEAHRTYKNYVMSAPRLWICRGSGKIFHLFSSWPQANQDMRWSFLRRLQTPKAFLSTN